MLRERKRRDERERNERQMRERKSENGWLRERINLHTLTITFKGHIFNHSNHIFTLLYSS